MNKVINIKNTRLLFLYRSFLFKGFTFKTNRKDLKEVVKALNIKDKKERISYVYDETIKALNTYYKDDLCQFIDGKCIVQRTNNRGKVNGCCRFCPLVTDKGCPSENVSCKLIYCKTSIKNIRLIRLRDIPVTKCLSISRRAILKGDFFVTKEQFLDDLCKGPIIYAFRTIKRDLKRNIK